MRKGLIGLSHAVSVLALLHRCALIVGRVEKLRGEAVFHGLAWALAGESDKPAHAHGLPAVRTDFHWDLVGGAADAVGAGPRRRGAAGLRPAAWRCSSLG